MSEAEAPPGSDLTAADFDWLGLDGDEAIVWADRPRLVGYAWTLVAGVLLAPLGVGLLLIAWTILTARNTAYVVTTDRVYKKTGVLSRNVTDIGHGKIQDTGYRQGFVGTQLGFGTVEISTAGGSDVELRFTAVSNPLAVQSTLDEVARTAPGGRATDGQRSADADSGPAAPFDELAAELRGTREALESIERSLERDDAQ